MELAARYSLKNPDVLLSTLNSRQNSKLLCNPLERVILAIVVIRTFRHVFLVILACSSLLASNVAACACSHHVEKKVVESHCHSHHDEAQAVEIQSDSDSYDTSCVCAVEQPSPFATSKVPTKEFKANDKLAKPEHIFIDVSFATLTAYSAPATNCVNSFSYSLNLRSLLPARAPPRL